MAKRKKKTIPDANQSPYGWWLASYIERLEFLDEDKKNLERRCLAWENTVLIKAFDRDEAYRKAVEAGRLGLPMSAWHPETGRPALWRFEGLTELMPIYDELEDGAELFWTEHRGRSVRRIQARVKKKSELPVFDDREPVGSPEMTVFNPLVDKPRRKGPASRPRRRA